MLNDLDIKYERLKQKVRQTKVLFKNNIEGSNEIIFAHNIYGMNKVVNYDITILGKNPANIVVKLDGVVISSTNGVISCGEILLKAHKLYSLCVECVGEEMLACKLTLDSSELRVI